MGVEADLKPDDGALPVRPSINWSPLFGFDVFISYKRQEVSRYAASLERQLRGRDIHCFLDDHDLPAGSPLADTVRTALRRSRALVIVVSPGSLRSQYVLDELRVFATYSRQIIPIRLAASRPLLIDAPPAGSAPGSSVQMILQQTDRVWIDEREEVTGLDDASPEVVERIVAFFGFFRANRRRRVFLGGLLAVILAGAFAAAFEAAIANQQRRAAFSRQLAAQSDQLRGQPFALETRVLLAIESMRLLPSIENDQALRESLYHLRRPLFANKSADTITALKFGTTGLVALARGDRSVHVFDGRVGSEVAHWIENAKVVSLAFSPNGKAIAAGTLEGSSRLVELDTGKSIAQLAGQEGTYLTALSGTGRWLARASKSGTLSVVDLSTGKEAVRHGQPRYISALAFSPDELWIAVGSDDGIVQVLEIGGGKRIALALHSGSVTALAFSPDSRWIASGGWDGTARVVGIADGKELPRPDPSGWRERVASAGGEPFSVMGGVRALAFSSDSRLVATGNNDSTARVFERATGKELLRLAHRDVVASIAFSPDARWIATGSHDATACIFETSGGREVAYLNQQGPVLLVAFSADGRRLFIGTGGTLSAFQAADGREVARLPEQNLLTTVRFSPDGRWLAVKSYDGQSIDVIDTSLGEIVLRLPRRDLLATMTLQPLDLANFKPTGKRLLYLGEGEPAAFSGDGRKVAIADDDGARVFAVPSGRKLAQLAEKEVEAVSFSPDGRWVASASADGEARVSAAANGAIVFTCKLGEGLGAMLFSPDSRLVATAGGDHEVHIFDVLRGKEVVRLPHRSAVEALTFSADSSRLGTGSSDGTARVFLASTGREVWHLSEQSSVGAVAFSPDGRWLATGVGRMARVFETASGKEVARMAHQASVTSLTISPDNVSVASASSDYTVRVFQADTGRELSRINVDGRIKAMNFMEGGRILQTASSGRLESEAVTSARSDYVSVQRDLLRPEELIREACSRLTRNLGEEQWKQYFGDRPYRRTCSRLP